MNRTTRQSPTEALLESLRAQLTACVEEERASVEAAELVRGMCPLPPGTPILADNKTAPALFSLSLSTLDKLRKRYPSFPAVQAGDKVLYNVYRVWEWFDQYPERVIDLY